MSIKLRTWMSRSYRELLEYKKFTNKHPRVNLKEAEIPIYPGDFVQVMKGPEQGKSGRVLAVYRSLNWVYVRALNMKTMKMKDAQGNDQYLAVERPFLPDEIQLIDPDAKNTPTKVRIVTTPKGTKFRLTDAGNALMIPRDGDPNLVGPYAQIPSYKEGPYDTKDSVVLAKTYKPSLNTVEEELMLKFKDYIDKKLREGRIGRINNLTRIPKKKWIINEYVPPYLEVVEPETKEAAIPKKRVKIKLSSSN